MRTPVRWYVFFIVVSVSHIVRSDIFIDPPKKSVCPDPNTPCILVAEILGANSTLTLHYQWYKGEVGDRSYPLGADLPYLYICGLGYSDSGHYFCYVYTGGNQETSSVSQFRVRDCNDPSPTCYEIVNGNIIWKFNLSRTKLVGEFKPGFGKSLPDAAMRCGYHHFNWIQYITEWNIPPEKQVEFKLTVGGYTGPLKE